MCVPSSHYGVQSEFLLRKIWGAKAAGGEMTPAEFSVTVETPLPPPQKKNKPETKTKQNKKEK